jgi:hypothetical protein
MNEQVMAYNSDTQEIYVVPKNSLDDCGISAYAIISVEALRKNLQEGLGIDVKSPRNPQKPMRYEKIIAAYSV